MREIFVNGVAFRYKTERDLSLILQHAREPKRLRFLSQLCHDVSRRRKTLLKISGLSGFRANTMILDDPIRLLPRRSQ